VSIGWRLQIKYTIPGCSAELRGNFRTHLHCISVSLQYKHQFTTHSEDAYPKHKFRGIVEEEIASICHRIIRTC
jgi:hypothetical protein